MLQERQVDAINLQHQLNHSVLHYWLILCCKMSSGGNRHPTAHVYLNESDSKLFSGSLYQIYWSKSLLMHLVQKPTYCFHFLQISSFGKAECPLGRPLSAVFFFGFCAALLESSREPTGFSVSAVSSCSLKASSLLSLQCHAHCKHGLSCLGATDETQQLWAEWCQPRKLCCLHTWVNPKAGKTYQESAGVLWGHCGNKELLWALQWAQCFAREDLSL